jgi:lipopolysaccharide transport system permease protein
MYNKWNARQYWDFVFFKSYADLKTEAERTYVGFLWWIAEPVLYMAIFYLVFAVILGSRTENYIAFLLIGLTIWRWFQSTVMAGSVAVSQSRGIIHQVYFPKIVLPVVSVVTNSVKFIVVFALLMLFLMVLGYIPGLSYLSLFTLLFVQLLFIIAMTMLVAALVPFLPDIRILLDNLLRGLFFMSGIFFDIEAIDEPYRDYLLLNPMASLITDYRNVMIYQKWPVMENLFSISVASIVILSIGVVLLKRFDRYYPRIVT